MALPARQKPEDRLKRGADMITLTITANEAGQRFDKLLVKYLNEAPKSFIYKMLRKKNITLNGKKASGSELLAPGDEVRLFFSDETAAKFHTADFNFNRIRTELDVIYEDAHIILINKPAGMLSQKADGGEPSLVEYLITYLLDSGSLTEVQLATFRPSVCNRLDRNTSGIVICGKSLAGLQEMSRLLKERAVHKYYRCIVKGRMQGERHLKGYLCKDHGTNKVTVSDRPSGDAQPIETKYRTIAAAGGLTMLEVLLITGRSHQIRAHLSSIGHPILGDPKYGDPEMNSRYRRLCGVKNQLLHAYRMEFPELEGTFAYLSGRCFTAPIPELYGRVMDDDRSRRAEKLQFTTCKGVNSNAGKGGNKNG